MPGLQEWIHAMEEGRGTKVVKIGLAVIGFVALAVIYNFLCFKNFNTPEAMDSAQLARNLSQGKGFTTDYIRPFSIHLLQTHRPDHDPLLKSAHPDLANAPVYPVLLAALFKVAPVRFEIAQKATFTTYQPERWIAALNQVLFFCAVVMTFFLARALFNDAAAWISAFLLAGTELLWRHSVSGLPTLWLLVLVLAIALCLVRLDEWQRNEISLKKMVCWGILTGILIGLAGLSHYSILSLILPVLLFALSFAPQFRLKATLAIVCSFLVVVTPWLIRNKTVAGTFFGTSSYSAIEQTQSFPNDTLARSLHPEFSKVKFKDIASKLLVNSHDILKNQVPTIGGSWIAAFFLAGILLRFHNPAATRLRRFVLVSLGLLIVLQALGHTGASDAAKDISAENFLVIFVPLIIVFGVGFYLVLLDQLKLTGPMALRAVSTGFILIISAPLLFTLLPPASRPFAYPPYHPPLIQEASSWVKEDELMMSDLPWAVAWYGNRPCVALTLDHDKDFFAINDDMKSISALYLSPDTTDSRFLSQVAQPKTWEQLAFQVAARGGEALKDFPLKSVREDLMPRHLFLADWARWKMPKK